MGRRDLVRRERARRAAASRRAVDDTATGSALLTLVEDALAARRMPVVQPPVAQKAPTVVVSNAEARLFTALDRCRHARLAAQEREAELAAAVAAVHGEGRSWAELGRVLGVSRQAARQRYGRATTGDD
ncbi:hypothetical protein [Cellulomonas endophytica]|uniref:hypothetical protein n=1 Tax=Cellulomonas endophytica TaxID=2494735 RepID=UPI0010118891|nr:hypothetical protein [Cellulomonas endophytica]